MLTLNYNQLHFISGGYLKKMAPTNNPNREKQAMYSHVKFSVTAALRSLNGTRSRPEMHRTMKSHIKTKEANVTTGLHLILPRYGILN